MPNARFAYDPDVAARFPSVAGGVVHAEGVSNGPSPPALVAAFRSGAGQARWPGSGTRHSPSCRRSPPGAVRSASFGVDPTTYRSAAEALLRRLTKQGSIPSINALVDIGNLVAIRYGLPVAMFDQRTVTGGDDRPFRCRHRVVHGPRLGRARDTRPRARSSSSTTPAS